MYPDQSDDYMESYMDSYEAACEAAKRAPCPSCSSTAENIQTVSGWGCRACGCYWSVDVMIPGPG